MSQFARASSCFPLPITAPLFAFRVREGEAKRAVYHRAVVHAAMIFQPRRMGGVLVQILRANIVVPAFDHAAKTREKAFNLIGRNAVEAVRNRVVDPLCRVVEWQPVPTRGFIRDDRAAERHDMAHDGNALWFMLADKRACAAIASA